MATFPPLRPPRTPSPLPPELSPTSADPASPNPAHAVRTHPGGTSRPLLSARRTSSLAGTPAASAAPPVPSRYAQCELCALVLESRRTFGYDDETYRPHPDQGGDEAGPSVPSSSRPRRYPQPDDRARAMAPVAGVGDASRIKAKGRAILYHDDDITAYAAQGNERLRPDGKHIMVVINQHAESVYDLGPSDIPLLSKILEVSRLLLGVKSGAKADLRIGFLGSIMRDPQSPHAHLHAQAMLGPPDPSLPGATFWRRNVVFGWGNWWSIEDLRAEIREETSNNRVKSGYEDRAAGPIDKVPAAASRLVLPNASEGSFRRDTT